MGWNILTWLRGNRDLKGGSLRTRPCHCTSARLTPAIDTNVVDSGVQFLVVGDCVRAVPLTIITENQQKSNKCSGRNETDTIQKTAMDSCRDFLLMSQTQWHSPSLDRNTLPLADAWFIGVYDSFLLIHKWVKEREEWSTNNWNAIHIWYKSFPQIISLHCNTIDAYRLIKF